MEGAAAQVAEVAVGMAHALVRGLAERTAARELLRAQEYEEDREWTRRGDAYYARFQEGYLCKLRSRGRWTLFMVWPDESTRVLIRGRSKDIERYAQEVLCYGPPGGPDYKGGELDWRVSDDDATVRAAAIGGELRLMPWQGEQHLLVLVQNDYGVAVLGRGLREVLLRTAEDLLDERCADTLHLRIGEARINLHGLGSASVVGYLDLQHAGQFVLGPAGDGDFGLFYKLGEYTRAVGVYTLDEVRRGDLGRTFTWCSNTGSIQQSRQSEVGTPQASTVAPAVQSEVAPSLHGVAGPAPPEVARPMPEVARPTPPPPEVAMPTTPPESSAQPSPEVTRPTPPPPEVAQPSGSAIPPPLAVGTLRQPSVATAISSAGISTTQPTGGTNVVPGAAITAPPEGLRHLSDQDLRLVERHLTLEDGPTGGGATAVPLLLQGVYRLVALGFADQLMRAVAFRSLLAKRCGIHFDCGARTFRRALLAVAAQTPLLKKVGHRWYLGIGALQRPDSELLQWIRVVTPPGTVDPAVTSREIDPGTDQSAAHERAAPPVPVEQRADHGTPPVTTARAVPQPFVDRTSGHERNSPAGPTPVTDQDGHLQAPVEPVADPEVFVPQSSAEQTPDASRTAAPAPTDPIADHERVPGPGSTGLADNASTYPRKEDTEPDLRAYAAAPDPAPNDETPAPRRWGYQRRLRTDGKPTVWRRRWEPLPAEQSASRHPGRKGRGPPRS